jgi:hypothetical protein
LGRGYEEMGKSIEDSTQVITITSSSSMVAVQVERK